MRIHMTGVLVALLSVGVASSAVAAARAVPLIEAVKQGNVATVRTLVAQKVNVNATEPDGTTALHWAADLGDVQTVDLLLKAGAALKSTNRYGATPFGLATAKGHAAVIERFLQAGEDANAVISGEPVLMQAARSGSVDAVKALLAKGAQVNVAEEVHGQTALMWAAAAGHSAVVKTLAEAGGDIKARNRAPGKGIQMDTGFRIPADNDPLGIRSHRNTGAWGITLDGLQFTPLMWAARAGHVDTVKTLLDLGANVNEAKPEGTTSLILAIINNHWELASKLLDWGADPNLGPGYTALHQVAWSRRINLKAAFHPGHPDPTGTVDSLSLAKKIIDKGAKVNAQMTESFKDNMRNRMMRIGATAFLLSSKVVDLPMLKLMLEHGADRTILNNNQDTPLMLAAGVSLSNPGEDAGNETETLATVKFLLELGESIQAKNKNGETALHGASYRGFVPVTQLLLDKGAELQVANTLGWTPLVVADGAFYAGIFKQQPAVAAALRQAYAKKGLPVPPPPNVEDESAKAEAANGGNLGTVGLVVGTKPEAAGAAPAGGAAPKK
ncbi:MAG: ankyrin repeat domain-containing protein [Vicinamibacterales bacterium]